MSFKELCEKMYNAFRRDGYPGINGIADAGDFWIFNPASETKEETDYGKHPYIVDKKTVSVRCFDYLDEDDWKLFFSPPREKSRPHHNTYKCMTDKLILFISVGVPEPSCPSLLHKVSGFTADCDCICPKCAIIDNYEKTNREKQNTEGDIRSYQSSAMLC